MSDSVRQELLKQSNQAAIDISFKALWSIFLLNGAAATALLSKDDVPIVAAGVFAFAALWAVVAMGITYLLCLAVTDFLFEQVNQLENRSNSESSIREKALKSRRFRVILFSSGPAVLFLVGLVSAAVEIS